MPLKLTCEEYIFPPYKPGQRGVRRYRLCGKPAKWRVSPGERFVCGLHVRAYRVSHGVLTRQFTVTPVRTS